MLQSKINKHFIIEWMLSKYRSEVEEEFPKIDNNTLTTLMVYKLANKLADNLINETKGERND
jgi:hypothetical protein